MTNPSQKPAIAVIDGNITRAKSLGAVLGQFYRVAVFQDGRKAMDELAADPCAVLVVDEMAPPFGGPALMLKLKDDAKLRGCGRILLMAGGGKDAETAALAAGAQAVLPRGGESCALLKAVSALVNRAVEAQWANLAEAPRNVLQNTVAAFNGLSDEIASGGVPNLDQVNDACRHLVAAVNGKDFRGVLDGVRFHDNYSYVHSLRVATFLSVFGDSIGLKGNDLLTLAVGGLVHDIGKMTIPLDVLNKPGRLEGNEWAIMQSHVASSVAVLNRLEHVSKGVIVIAEQHHEKMDGTGYPHGLKGSQLSELARMASIVDVFGALTDRRVYKQPMTPEAALDLMVGQMSAGLDQTLLARFRQMLLDAARAGP